MYQQTTLANGLRIVCETIPHVHSVSLGIWVGTGSRYEEPQYNGISHFIEHMLFKGTGRRTTKQIAEEMDAVGGQLNAFTTKEYTCFYAKLLDKHFRFGIDLLSDMVTNSLFLPEELEKEKQVVIEEIKSYEDSPDELIHDIFAGAVLKGHPLGWTILGTPETIRGIDREVILQYLSHHYTPDNIVFAVAGNVQFDQIVAEVAQRFEGLAGHATKQLPSLPRLEQDVVIRSKETEQVHICLGTRGVERSSPEKFTVFVLDSILGGSVSSRLFQELREERGLVYMAGSNHSAYQDTGLFSIYAGTSMENFEEVISLVKSELRKLRDNPVGAAELARAKEQLKGNLLLSLESTCNRMSRIAKLVLFQEPLTTPEESVARIDQVDAAQVLEAARAIFDENKLVITAVGPFAEDSELLRKGYHEY
ncbi:putative Zn-dependent peptidase [Hydrogenispora ethanolica]|uniref:Putative Zn-dependent peptidase n=1 Tax=Hydrogenispora ethanolica TaxID=1082276 RepID=A0A4R1S5U2_HYDET|nr:pitrilysin family protein [Hydrogenispora ethanolica]TCL74140.1 putative Zn-dependent peptidase [Hydrogenispora ethanolica]